MNNDRVESCYASKPTCPLSLDTQDGVDCASYGMRHYCSCRYEPAADAADVIFAHRVHRSNWDAGPMRPTDGAHCHAKRP